MSHLHIVGALSRDRRAHAVSLGQPDIVAACHKQLRGPYTGIDTFLSHLLPEALRQFPDLVDRHRLTLLYGMPELVDLIGTGPRELASDAPFAERTRFYSASMVRCMSQGIITFLHEYALATQGSGRQLPSVMFDGVDRAERTAQEFIGLLIRRVDPGLLRVVVGTHGGTDAELARALASYATVHQAPALPDEQSPGADLLAIRYVDSDGTDDDPAAVAAYQQLDSDQRAVLHDRRAEELEASGGWGVRVGALPYHREHGSDPRGAGVAAILAATQYCTSVGFSAMVVELGLRGRALIDQDRQPDDYRKLTNQVAAAMIPCGQLAESLELLHELRRLSSSPLTHMTTSYSLAMMYTRFLEPRDHEQAMEWENNAMAIASLLPDEHDRLIYTGFQDNAMALIQMHRGNLQAALSLVENALARSDSKLRPDEWVLHRSQLLYNRTRLLAGLGRKDEAYQGFSTLIEMDPHYTDYLSERAKISRRRGDGEAAIADYTMAVEQGPPFPELFYNRGSTYLELGDVEAALADFAYVLDMEPDDTDTRVIRADLLYNSGDLVGALRDVELGLQVRPDEPRLRCLRGCILLAQDQPAAARDDFDVALRVDPSFPAALANRALASFELGDPAASAADLSTALELHGNDPDLLLNRGIARAACGDAGSALVDFDAALGLPEADQAEIQFQRGLCQLSQGNRGAAQASFQTALQAEHRVDEICELLQQAQLQTS